MTKDARLIERAAGIALTSECRQRHGALVVKGSRILAWSPNKNRNSPATQDEALTVHAEDGALRELCRFTGQTYGHGVFKGYTIYVARINRKGDTMLSRPCSKCMDTITWQGITTVVYTNEVSGYSVENIA